MYIRYLQHKTFKFENLKSHAVFKEINKKDLMMLKLYTTK